MWTRGAKVRAQLLVISFSPSDLLGDAQLLSCSRSISLSLSFQTVLIEGLFYR